MYLKTQSCLKQCIAAKSLQEESVPIPNTQYYATFSMAYIRPRYGHAQHTQIDEKYLLVEQKPKSTYQMTA